MHSSISSFELVSIRVRARTRIVWPLIATVLLTLVGFEAFARLVVERKSAVQRTLNEEYREAVDIRPGTGNHPKQLLIVGNSLVGLGLDLDFLRKRMPRDLQVHRFWVFGTAYNDWYFGLRRLMQEGSRPDVIAVVFAGLHWYSNDIRGDYSSQYLFEPRDLLLLKSRLDLDMTTTSSLLVAHYSKFYALRSVIRNVALTRAIPDLPRIGDLVQATASRPTVLPSLAPLLASRFKSFRDIVEPYGVKLVLVVPPIPHPRPEFHDLIRTAAADAGVPVIIPLSADDIPRTMFLDDIHLNPEGARLFTSKLARQLVPVVEGRTPTPTR